MNKVSRSPGQWLTYLLKSREKRCVLYKCLLSVADVIPCNRFLHLLLSAHFVSNLTASDEQRTDKLWKITLQCQRIIVCAHGNLWGCKSWAICEFVINRVDAVGKYKFHIVLSGHVVMTIASTFPTFSCGRNCKVSSFLGLLSTPWAWHPPPEVTLMSEENHSTTRGQFKFVHVSSQHQPLSGLWLAPIQCCRSLKKKKIMNRRYIQAHLATSLIQLTKRGEAGDLAGMMSPVRLDTGWRLKADQVEEVAAISMNMKTGGQREREKNRFRDKLICWWRL